MIDSWRWTHPLITFVKPLFSHLYNLRRIKKFLSLDCPHILVNAFVTSHLNYCHSLLYGLPHNLLCKLQRVQNAAARLICNVGRFSHITPTLFSLHWLPIRNRIQFKFLLFTYKALNGLAPAYITELLKLKTIPRYNLGSSDDKLLLQHPNIRTGSRYSWWPFIYSRVTKAMERSHLWLSAMPLMLYVAAFKRLLKTRLFRKAWVECSLMLRPFCCLFLPHHTPRAG